MITHGKGTNGRRPYRGLFGQERMEAAKRDLQRAIDRAKARPFEPSEPHTIPVDSSQEQSK